MRLYGFVDNLGLSAVGVLIGRSVVPISELDGECSAGVGLDYHSTNGLLDEPEMHFEAIDQAVRKYRRTRRGRRLRTLRVSPAISDPGKIVCIGLNYRDHVEEQHIPLPDRPTLFSKFANAVIADGQPIVRPPGTHALDLEVELGVVIGRTARRARRVDAWDHVAGYVVVNDVSARDWQGQKAALRPGEHGDGQWLRAKGSDTFLPMGPVFVSADEIADPGNLSLRSWRFPGSGPDAGRQMLMQDGTTADMIFDIPALIEFVSASITLEAGDVIATGTPSGVGVFRDPPVFLEPGDRVRVEIEGIGALENPIVDWSEAPS